MRMKRRILLILTVLPLFSNAQQPVVKNLVFEGAGIRGIAYCGAIMEMEQRGILQQVQRVGGTSSGAITALLLSIGYTAKEIEDIIWSTPFKKFNDGKFFFVGGIRRIQKYFGWYRGQQFEKWISRLIAAKTGDADIRFGELKEKGFKELFITGTCLNKQTLVVFSHENYPQMKIRDAVRISMSIPLYFEAVFVDSAGKIAKRPRNKEGLDIMTDGGLTGNFPIRMFDSSKYLGIDSINHFVINKETVGIRIDREEQIVYDQNGKRELAPIDITSLDDYFRAFYTIVIENLNRQHLTDEDWARTISISDGNISPRIRKLSKEELSLLRGNGEAASRHFYQAKRIETQ